MKNQIAPIWFFNFLKNGNVFLTKHDDYLLETNSGDRLLIIEAKYEDLIRGFTQLVAELIAIDQWQNAPPATEQPILIGAVSTGAIWQFGRLDRAAKQFEQGINSCRVPEDLETVMRILVATLKQKIEV